MIHEVDLMIQSSLRKTQQTEVAVISEIAGDGLSARVQRQGQTVETRFLPLASGLSVSVSDRVQVVRINGNLNTAYIAAVVA